MADTKITSLLTPQVTTNPATDVLPIVNIADTSMASSGSTRKITVNTLLGSGGTATLASATITGAATVGTTLGVTGVSTLASATITGQLVAASTSGHIGFGTTPSAWGSSIKGLDIGAWTSVAQIGAASFLGFNSYASTTGQFNYKNSGAIALGYFQQSAGHLWLNAISNAGAAGANATFTTAMTLDTSGRLLVGPTSANANGGILQLSSGITFPATQVASSDANTLDDYEEGTWTIGLTFGGGSTGITTTGNTGRYTKVGRQVTVSGILSLSNKGSSTGLAEITGLPFTIANANEAYSAASVRFNGISFADVPICIGATNSTKILLQEITNAGVVSDITDADFANTSSCVISFTYTV